MLTFSVASARAVSVAGKESIGKVILDSILSNNTFIFTKSTYVRIPRWFKGNTVLC
jgi:hypothetical protein